MKLRAVLTALLITALAVLGVGLLSGSATSTEKVHKSYVCKYITTPGEGEVLQTGDNPIYVDNHSLTGKDNSDVAVGDSFSDAHGRSVVIVANTLKLDPEPGIEACSTTPPPETTTPPVETTTPPVETTTPPVETTTPPVETTTPPVETTTPAVETTTAVVVPPPAALPPPVLAATGASNFWTTLGIGVWLLLIGALVLLLTKTGLFRPRSGKH